MRRSLKPPLQKATGDSERLPKYTIGVVSELLGLPPHELRRYEKTGLVEPARQTGKNRLYSDQDVALLEELATLAQEGVNAAGIRQIIQMRQRLRLLQLEIDEARRQQQSTEVKLTYLTSLLFNSTEPKNT